MELTLKRPICFFDLETTGINITKDRIVEISILKIFPNGNKESKTWLVNPMIPIPPETTAVHGITNEKVKDAPTFKQISKKIKYKLTNFLKPILNVKNKSGNINMMPINLPRNLCAHSHQKITLNSSKDIS